MPYDGIRVGYGADKDTWSGGAYGGQFLMLNADLKKDKLFLGELILDIVLLTRL